jgi:hypothetical protein
VKDLEIQHLKTEKAAQGLCARIVEITPWPSPIPVWLFVFLKEIDMRLEIKAGVAALIIREHLIRNKIKLKSEVTEEEDFGGSQYFAVEIDPLNWFNKEV